jgi:hypothetical protein
VLAGAGAGAEWKELLQVWPAVVDGDELPLRGGEGSVSWAQGATAGLLAQPCVGRS